MMTDTNRSIYIAGPMSGIPEFNFPAFNAAEDTLAKAGWKVWNPARKDLEADLDTVAVESGDAKRAIEKGFDFREAYTWDVTKIIQSDGIFMLKNWEQSPGARGEHAVAVAMQRHYPEFAIIYE